MNLVWHIPRRLGYAGLVAATVAACGLTCVSGAPAAAPKRQVPAHFLGTVADGPLFEKDTLAQAHASLGGELDRMVAAGVESIRVSFYWAPMQPYRSWEEVPA